MKEVEKKETEYSVRGRSRAMGTGQTETEGRKKRRTAAGAAASLLVCALFAYIGMAQKYKTAYFPNTRINGVEASGKTPEEVKALIADETRAYVLKLEERGGKTEQIAGEAIDLHPEFDGTLELLLEKQKPYEWGLYQLGLRSALHSMETMVLYEEDALKKEIDGLFCLRPEEQTAPEDAKISDYVSGQGYSIVPEEEGTVVLKDALREAAAEKIQNLQETLSLEEAGVYQQPELRSDHQALKDTLETMNRYAGVTVIYQFGDQTERLDGDRISEWLSVDADGTVALSQEGIASYVEELAAKYNTSNKAKTLKTSYGSTIQVKGGTYGWRINQSEETKELEALIRSGESQTREPVYGQRAASRGENDYGTTYVELNLTAQHLFFYQEGKLLVESDFVSGNLSRGWGTPEGTYPLTYKQKNAVLKGETYRTPVDYWMPFNGGIGMHDATWRSSFGGTIYKTNGSHGCINLPHQVAKTIYEHISAGMPVICYHLSGTEKASASSTKKPVAAEATAAPAETTGIPETAEAPADETASDAPVSGELSVKPGTGEISMIEDSTVGVQTQESASAEEQPQSPANTDASSVQGSGPASDTADLSGTGNGPAA